MKVEKLFGIISWRGEPDIHDGPQHIYQTEITVKLLDKMLYWQMNDKFKNYIFDKTNKFKLFYLYIHLINMNALHSYFKCNILSNLQYFLMTERAKCDILIMKSSKKGREVPVS